MTANISQTVYRVVNWDKSFHNFEAAIHFQELSGIDMGIILHSAYACTNIVNLISIKRGKTFMNEIIRLRSKILIILIITARNQHWLFIYTLCLCLCLCRGGFPHAPRPYMVYCTSPMDIQTTAMRTHRASPLVPPTREQRN
jgi:hypothetical protein